MASTAHTIKRTTPDTSAPNRAYRKPLDGEQDARLIFQYNGNGCVIASRDAGGVWHTIPTCSERGVICRCVRI